jgi:hypothetical protein
MKLGIEKKVCCTPQAPATERGGRGNRGEGMVAVRARAVSKFQGRRGEKTRHPW